MTSKPRFPDPATLAPDPVLDALKPRSSASKTTSRPFDAVTFVGRSLLADSAADHQQRIKQLEAERNLGGVLLKLDPKCVAPSPSANRLGLGLTMEDSSFAELYHSIRVNGQDTPIVVRPAPPGSAPIEYEIVEGLRRHSVCSLLDRETEGGFSIIARLVEAAKDEKVHFLRMFRENFIRQDLSPFEQGRMFSAALKKGLFSTQDELAEACQVGRTTLLRYIQVADLPSEVLAAFRDPRSISLRWIVELMKAVKTNPASVARAALELGARDPAPPPADVYKALISAGARDEARDPPSREEAIKIGGQVAFRIKSRGGLLSLRFGKSVNQARQKELEQAIKELTEKKIRSWE